ncbi:hypothetical protein MJO28_007479 [Puccinia striiformis f. sp. tritici]|uniref:Uncharacterized protein n=4 Tax=Puccinia striiformis TaxID=27350 RepID=A0A0L0VW92_9BASI|nr:hypothetical protein MJO28_007479 [Puccinia striiformis f. sp. tritici]KAI9612405.1 hypothetical protein KEM48_004137 [Puccinia striiformis f. sp. tritici PST-130]KNF03528.1 hypothetical protein PSTG_03462 [Puccinia striiformis f. sp. tritici PST-78]POW22801.1 hypothetical protein PSHT_00845 [Puccinia striiformis]
MFKSLIKFNCQPIKFSRPRPKRILQRSWTKYNLNPEQISQLTKQGSLPQMEKRIRPSVSDRSINPPNDLEITFLGTSAGKPTIQRNPSSLALRMDGQIWIFDCGEATTHQIMRTNLKASNVTKIFITHLHGDHVLGLISFLSHIGDRAEADLTSKNQHPFCDPNEIVEIYGPSGIREFVRSTLRLTKTHSPLKIKINELLRSNSSDHIYTPSLGNPNGPGRLWHNELLGQDIWSDSNGFWKDLIPVDVCGVSVSAAPIQHTIDCVGYLLNEVNRREKFDMVKLKPILERNAAEIKSMGFKVLPAILSQLEKTRKPITFSSGETLNPPSLSIRGRRIMILGDTCDPRMMVKLVQDSNVEGIDLLIHEATGTTVPDTHQSKQEELLTESQLCKKMAERGHSTSFMAGQFAHRVNASRLILNHLGGKYPAPQAALCPFEPLPSAAKPSSSSKTHSLPDQIHSGYGDDQNGMKKIHASLWKTYDEIDFSRKEKIRFELDWLKSVETDALNGYQSAIKQHERSKDSPGQPPIDDSINQKDALGTVTGNLTPPTLNVSVAYDFLQIKILRTDSLTNPTESS